MAAGRNLVWGDIHIIKEFDNISISNLDILLKENTVLKRYYPLIPIWHKLTKQLIELGITDKYAYFEWVVSSAALLSNEMNIDIAVPNTITAFLHLYDFKSRKLSEIVSVNPELIKALNGSGIKTSGDYLMLCISNSESSIAKMFNDNVKDVIKLFNLCDLMRLPGVKSIRADLYYECNYKSLQDFSVQNYSHMQEQISQYISNNNVHKSVPFEKELTTQIAVAKVLPNICFR